METFKNIVRLGEITEKTFKQKRKPLGQWQLASLMGVQHVLTEILDYLPAKRKQAELVLEFIASRIERGVQDGHVPLSEREKEIREEVRKLNMEGSQ